jgi:hypothetical protein
VRNAVHTRAGSDPTIQTPCLPSNATCLNSVRLSRTTKKSVRRRSESFFCV